MRNDSVNLTPLGELVYTIGLGVSLALIGLAVIRLFGYVVVWTAQLLGIN
jgi:hypothetical protein